MIAEVNEKIPEITAICQKYGVRKLEVFGSAANGEFDPARRDIDFLVEFSPDSPYGPAKRFFGLLEVLEDLFGRHVDLVETAAIRNPYFLKGVESSRTVLYAA